ncbi:MAG: N-acetylmuramoyl-L-alanine amidase [Anaerolineae bacterium]|nr:N-acetylmuramoyl-L-alanine amidase [Anaerolineae bacterium]MDW8070040.1 N-acetylmuramoyl-L-alanine amidase [Anaerolineae bacterium]
MVSRRRTVGGPLRRRVLLIAAQLMLSLAGLSLMSAVALSVWLVVRENLSSTPAPALTARPTLSESNVLPPTHSDRLLVPMADHATHDLASIVSADDVPSSRRVGIVAGHAGYDPGAVCPNGLTEAEVNMAVVRIVVELLSQQGYQVDLLEEFDTRLKGYRADALVSIHADSCEVPGASGFKVARVTHSAIPEAEDRLVECLYREYEAVTGLPRHPNSITDNMTNYHAFHEIDPYTPGAIIEIGFMLEDYAYIVRRPRMIARGIVNGILCFLQQNP